MLIWLWMLLGLRKSCHKTPEIVCTTVYFQEISPHTEPLITCQMTPIYRNIFLKQVCLIFKQNHYWLALTCNKRTMYKRAEHKSIWDNNCQYSNMGNLNSYSLQLSVFTTLVLSCCICDTTVLDKFNVFTEANQYNNMTMDDLLIIYLLYTPVFVNEQSTIQIQSLQNHRHFVEYNLF